MLVLMFRSILLPVALTMLGACHQIEPAPPPLRPRDPAAEAKLTETKVASAPTGTNVAQPKERAPAAGAIVPKATVEEVEPGQEALAEAILAASNPSLSQCRGNAGGGMLRLRVVGSKVAARITIDPASTVNDDVRRCVLEALSTIDVPDTLSQASPSMRPSAGFSSTIAVNW